MTQPYPLAWPRGWPRTPASERQQPKFRAMQEWGNHRGKMAVELTVAVARKRLMNELDAIRATSPVLSSDIELRIDGQPRSGREPDDPGVAVYFHLKGKPVVLPCDRWRTVAGNIAAVAAHIGAMRGMDRWGVGTMDNLFQGFLALPAPGAAQPWQEVLGIAAGTKVDATFIEHRRRALAMQHHPDKPGGSQEAMAKVNAAADQALRELG